MKQGIKLAVAKLELKPGDILAVRLLRRNVSNAEMARIQDDLSRFVGKECRVLVMDREMELTVVKPSAADPLDVLAAAHTRETLTRVTAEDDARAMLAQGIRS